MTLLAAVYCKLLYKRQTTQLGQLERRAIEALSYLPSTDTVSVSRLMIFILLQSKCLRLVVWREREYKFSVESCMRGR